MGRTQYRAIVSTTALVVAVALSLTTARVTEPGPAAGGAGPSIPLVAVPVDASAVAITWTPPPTASSVALHRDGRLIDRIRPEPVVHYVDRALWPETDHVYEIAALDARGRALAVERARATTLPRVGSFPTLFSPDSFWNQRIPPNAETDRLSDRLVRHALVAYSASANFANSDRWGVASSYASTRSKWYEVRCTRYDCSTDVEGRIPRGARPATGSDRHLAVVDPESSRGLDMWQASYRSLDDSWSAGSRFVTDPNGWGACGRPQSRCNGAVAAGFALMGGVVRPEEIAQGHIDHALAFTTPLTRAGFIACPATHTDGRVRSNKALPEGARIQLDPSFDVDGMGWPRWKKVIARALQEYGAFLVDTGGSLAVRGEADVNRGYQAWRAADTPVGGRLSDLPWHRFRVLELERC